MTSRRDFRFQTKKVEMTFKNQFIAQKIDLSYGNTKMRCNFELDTMNSLDETQKCVSDIRGEFRYELFHISIFKDVSKSVLFLGKISSGYVGVGLVRKRSHQGCEMVLSGSRIFRNRCMNVRWDRYENFCNSPFSPLLIRLLYVCVSKQTNCN